MRLRAGMRIWLLAVSVLASLPLLLFAAYSIYDRAVTQRRIDVTELALRTEATANAVQQRLGTAAGYLNGIATSDAARRGDLPALYEHAQRVLRIAPDARAISLVGPDEKMIFLTLRPLGAAGTVAGDLDAVRQVFRTGKPVVSGPFKSPVSDAIIVTVGVPVLVDGKAAYCLRMVLLSSNLNALLAAQKLPPAWISAIADRNGLILARSHAPERWIGQEVVPDVKVAMRAAKPEVLDMVTRDGIPSAGYVVKVPGWDWYVVIGVPTATLNAALNHAVTMLALACLLTLLAGALASTLLSRHIRQRIDEVARAAGALQRGERLDASPSPISELHNIVRAFRAVAEREDQVKQALLNASAQARQAASRLESAQRDALTGLPGRVQFLELVERLRQVQGGHGGRKLALLYIDLDGFKAVNDTFGHERGDRVLVQTADVLRSLTRETDAAARFGGDEFVICLLAPGSQIDGVAANVAARVIQRIGEIGMGIGCSIGIAICPEQCAALACAIRHADQAMYEAKRQGKNRYIFFGTPGANDAPRWLLEAPPECHAPCELAAGPDAAP